MTTISSGGGGNGRTWFQFFAEPQQLDNDLPMMTDDEKLKLLRDFVYEADQCDKMKKQTGDPLTTVGTTVPPGSPFNDGQAAFFMDNNNGGRENHISQMGKSQVLCILALKCLVNLKFNINLIHTWGVPICLVGNLLRFFLKYTTGVPTFNEWDANWPGWTGISRFSHVLYHFWTLLEGLDRVLIKPYKKCLTPPLPGLTEVPDVVFVTENNAEEANIVSRLESSAQILSVILDIGNLSFEIPTIQSFRIPDLDNEGTGIKTDEIEGIKISTESMSANIMFFLGRHCFQRKEFDRALGFFQRSKQSLDGKYNNLYFVGLTSRLLDSYISLCLKLIPNGFSTTSSSKLIENRIQTQQWEDVELVQLLMNDLFQRFEFSVVDVLNSENIDICPLTLQQRERLERELANYGEAKGDRKFFFQVAVCNLLERVISGHAILTNFITDLGSVSDISYVKDILTFLTQQSVYCLKFFHEKMKKTGDLKRSFSCPNIFTEEITLTNDFHLEIQNIKCFINFMAQCLPSEYEYPTIICNSDLIKYFSTEEANEIKALLNDVINLEDLEIYDLEDGDGDWFLIHERVLGNLSGDSDSEKCPSSMNKNEVDTLRLLTSYDIDEISSILTRLQKTGSINRITVINLCDAWTLTQSFTDEIKKIKNDNTYVNTYVLLCKANVLRELKSWDLAGKLYNEVLRINSGDAKIKKLVDNEITCNDLQKFLLTYQDLNPYKLHISGYGELVERAKSCLTYARLNSESWITDNLLTSCCCFFLTVKEYDYLLSIPNTISTTHELATLLITISRDFEKNKFLKSPKDLFEFLLKVMVPTKKPGVYNCMSQSQLHLFIELLGNGILLDLLISGLVSILTCLHSDINLSRPLYPKDIWPTTISNTFNTTIDTRHLDDLVLFSIEKAINQNPYNYNWLFVKADLAISESDFFKAMRCYLEAGAAATEFFTKPITKEIYTDWVLQQMIRCCREMGYHHQAIFLSQYIPDINLAAQMASEVSLSNDSSDLYVHLMWDMNLIEILAAIEFERGAFSKHKKFIDVLNQPDMNSSNPQDIIVNSQERKKLEFLRLISMQYLMR